MVYRNIRAEIGSCRTRQYIIINYNIAQLNRFTFNPISHQGFWRSPTYNFVAFPPTAYNLNNINQGPILADSSGSGEILRIIQNAINCAGPRPRSKRRWLLPAGGSGELVPTTHYPCTRYYIILKVFSEEFSIDTFRRRCLGSWQVGRRQIFSTTTYILLY